MGVLVDNLLSLVTFLPVFAALLVAFVPAEDGKLARGLALSASIATFFLSLGLLLQFDAASAAVWQLETKVPWLPALGIGYHVGVDGVSLLLVLLATFLTPIVLWSASGSITQRQKEFAIAILVLETAMIGSFVALDLILFYVFWELVLVPMFLIVGIWGSEERIYAAVKFFLYTMVGSLLMLIAILYVFWQTGSGGAERSFDLGAFEAVKLGKDTQVWLFAAFALAFAVKVPMFPFHTWLPDAHVQAPAPGSVILAGVMLKMGTYGFYRFAFPLFPEGAFELRNVLVVLSVIGIIYGSLMSIAQRDMKKLVAYSSVAHLGFVMLGLVAFTSAGVTGAVYQMLNHGISTGGLFLLIGMMYERRHTRLLADYGGMAKVVPAFATIWLIVTLSSIGLPGTNGFIGEFLILSGTFVSKLPDAKLVGALASTGVVLGAVYMLFMYQRVWHGPITHEANRHVPDLRPREYASLLPLVALIFVMGLFPKPFLALAEPGVKRFVAKMEQARPELAGDPRPQVGPLAVLQRAIAPTAPTAQVRGPTPAGLPTLPGGRAIPPTALRGPPAAFRAVPAEAEAPPSGVLPVPSAPRPGDVLRPRPTINLKPNLPVPRPPAAPGH